jgi:hypothetical protein
MADTMSVQAQKVMHLLRETDTACRTYNRTCLWREAAKVTFHHCLSQQQEMSS